MKPSRTPLRLPAAGNEGLASNFLDGELCMPVIYERALSAKKVEQRFDAQGLRRPEGKGVIACWAMSEEMGNKVAEVSGHGRHGKITNGASWMDRRPIVR